mgnify:CR=1 FL=1
MIQHPECEALWHRGKQVLAGGPATLSKHPSRFAAGISPLVLETGAGPYVTCADGQIYVDTIAALGPVLLGYHDIRVDQAVHGQILNGIASTSLMTRLEIEVAEILCTIIPGAEQCRFGRNGKDVTEAAVRLARHVTGHRHMIYIGYSGGYSDYLITTDKAGGVLAQLAMYNHQVPWRDFETLMDILASCDHDLAGIMVEVPSEAPGTSRDDTRQVLANYQVQAVSHHGLFILDNIVTGFRLGLGGALSYYGIVPDLSTHSKAIANGFPLAALTGPRTLMQAFENGKVFLSTTFAGEATAFAAAKATLTVLRETDALVQLQHHGEALVQRLRYIITQMELPVDLYGDYARMTLKWRDVPGVVTAPELYTLWLQEMIKRGVLCNVPLFSMCCWNATIVDAIMHAACGAFQTIYEVVHEQRPINDALEVPIIGAVLNVRA